MNRLTAALFALFLCLSSSANDFDNAWDALNRNDLKGAEAWLQKAKRNPATAFDAYLTDLLIRTFNGKEDYLEGFLETLAQQKDKNEYLYALWFNGTALGDYGKKTKPHQLKLLHALLTDHSYNGSMQCAAHYVRAMHYLFANDLSRARQDWQAMGALENWQLTGPFENISGTGFHSSFGPLVSSGNKSVFKSKNNVDISWFTPPKTNREGWVFTGSHIPENTAVVYTQTFVNAPSDMNVLLNAGGNGSLKIWVNDELILAESKERTTELDYYKNGCRLNKGYNRILVQLGYVDNDKPNFILRLTDNNGNALKELTATATEQPYAKSSSKSPVASAKHFAEDFFEKKITADPDNLLHYILLSQTYLRCSRFTEAREVIQKALAKAPNNILLQFELLQCLMKAGNRTLMMQELERLKESAPESFVVLRINMQKLLEEEKYDEAAEKLSRMVALYGEDETTIESKITILARQNKVEELLKLIESAYKKYPENLTFLQLMYKVKKEVLKDTKGALALYERHLKNNYNFGLLNELAGEYKALGMNEKHFSVIKGIYEEAGYDPRFPSNLSDYFFEKQNYAKALEYAGAAIQLAPYVGQYWKNIAVIQEQMNKKSEAVINYTKALYYDRTNYDARKKLNALQQKPDLYKMLPEINLYELIKKAPAANTEYNFTYLLDEKNVIVYDAGALEEYVTTVVKLYNQKGIDAWKEYYVSYNSYNQNLLIEKSEAVKPNGTKVPAEQNGDAIVFTGLEAGDAIIIKYRLQNYAQGRMSREFWDKFVFNSTVPCQASRYTLIVPKDLSFQSEVLHAAIRPSVQDKGEYKLYTWEIKDMPALKSEPLMPPLNDAGTVLHLSTLNNWAEVANWYSDLSYQDVADDYDLNTLYREILEGKKPASDLEKAKMIYNYIVTNIRYSSIPFRQSGLVPQSISKIINTKLGDCKDLSSLFAALAAKAGLKAQLVLVNTRNNGAKDILLPSVAFNHCIALLTLSGKEYYLELTDSNLPFGSLPQNLYGAASLVIPPQGQKATGAALKPLLPASRSTDKLVKNITVIVAGKDVQFNVVSAYTGSLTSGLREQYSTLSPDKQKEEWEQSIAGRYKNGARLESLSFKGFENLQDSITAQYNYTAKNEVIEAGSMKMIKLPLLDVVASVDNFTADRREHPIEYWNYENTDVYQSTITIRLPAGKKLVEVPANQTFTFNNSAYSITYSKVGEALKVERRAKLQRDNIPVADYEKFKKFFSNIVEAESKYIVFK